MFPRRDYIAIYVLQCFEYIVILHMDVRTYYNRTGLEIACHIHVVDIAGI